MTEGARGFHMILRTNSYDIPTEKYRVIVCYTKDVYCLRQEINYIMLSGEFYAF